MGIILAMRHNRFARSRSGSIKEGKIPIQSGDIGQITRRDVLAASVVRERNRYIGVILGFNVKVLEEAEKEKPRKRDKDF